MLNEIGKLGEYIYLLQERESLRCHDEIYKIGRTKQEGMSRIKNYPKGSKVWLMIIVNDSVKAENDLLDHFDKMFVQVSDVGREYYKGNPVQMMEEIIKYQHEHFDINIETTGEVLPRSPEIEFEEKAPKDKQKKKSKEENAPKDKQKKKSKEEKAPKDKQKDKQMKKSNKGKEAKESTVVHNDGANVSANVEDSTVTSNVSTTMSANTLTSTVVHNDGANVSANTLTSTVVHNDGANVSANTLTSTSANMTDSTVVISPPPSRRTNKKPIKYMRYIGLIARFARSEKLNFGNSARVYIRRTSERYVFDVEYIEILSPSNNVIYNVSKNNIECYDKEDPNKILFTSHHERRFDRVADDNIEHYIINIASFRIRRFRFSNYYETSIERNVDPAPPSSLMIEVNQ